MHSLDKLERQQIGLRLPKYLVEEIDAFTKEYALNRTDIIIKAIKSYINEQKALKFYEDFDVSCKELKNLLDKEDQKEPQTLDGLINELEDH